MSVAAALDPSVIVFEHVSKQFERPGDDGAFLAIDDLSLRIGRGELVAIVGKTGCGKSTMFSLIAGLGAPSRGQVLVQGRDPFRAFDSFRGEIAVVFQNDRLLPWRTAAANVELGLEMLDAAPAERRQAALKWLSRLGLGGHENDYPHQLSGGMRQRVSIARAFATNASILLCDEPFSALDEITGQKLREEFVSLVRENGKTAIFVTHSINEALQIGDRILVLRRPAKIAADIDLTSPDRQSSEDVRLRIQQILAE